LIAEVCYWRIGSILREIGRAIICGLQCHQLPICPIKAVRFSFGIGSLRRGALVAYPHAVLWQRFLRLWMLSGHALGWARAVTQAESAPWGSGAVAAASSLDPPYLRWGSSVVADAPGPLPNEATVGGRGPG
jgi:hypothetical protein